MLINNRYFLIVPFLIGGCNPNPFNEKRTEYAPDSSYYGDTSPVRVDSPMRVLVSEHDSTVPKSDTGRLPVSETINTGKVKPAELVKFARTLVGVPYRYASSDPKIGFDCSGFITHVFNHF